MHAAVVSPHAMSVPVAGVRIQRAALSRVAVAATVHRRPGRRFTEALYPGRVRTAKDSGLRRSRSGPSALAWCMFLRMRPISLLALTACLAVTARAQVISLDEGSFTVTRAGDRIGREDFSIRSSPGAAGPVLVAHAIVTMGTRRVEPSLNADTSGGVFKYQTEVREDGRAIVTYSGELARDHYRARSSRPDGESSREFRLPAGTVAADDDVVHQLWFIARRGPGAAVHVLAPLRNAVETVRVELVGGERLSIGSREFDARRLRLRTLGSGATRDVWVDSAGRLLKVEIPASRIVAVRDEPPR
jgi:hypothetical protein